MEAQVCIKSYKCNQCGFIKEYFSSPALSNQRNVIADNCPQCQLGSMIVDFDDERNFKDNFLERYFPD